MALNREKNGHAAPSQPASPSSSPHGAPSAFAHDQASGPLAQAGDNHRSAAQDLSFGFSSGGDDSVIVHSLSENTSASGLDSSFDAVNLSQSEQSGADSSLEIIVHSSPKSSGFLASSPPRRFATQSESPIENTKDLQARLGASQSRRPSLIAIDEQTEPASLDPAARAFAPPPRPEVDRISIAFQGIVVSGKNEFGNLTEPAKDALARLGLKPIPALHGPLNLPYARCASGVDAFLSGNDPDTDPWIGDANEGGTSSRQQRTLPIPLPGNSRYTQAGRLVMRYSSAPASMDSRSGRVNRLPVAPKPNVPAARAKKPAVSRPSQSKAANPTEPEIVQANTHQALANARVQADTQTVARAQAMQLYFLQQAQIAQQLGEQAAIELLADQTAGLGLNESSISPQHSTLLAFPQEQSRYLSSSHDLASGALPSSSFLSPSPAVQHLPILAPRQPRVYTPSQVDSSTLLKLAGQRQLGLQATATSYLKVPRPEQPGRPMPLASVQNEQAEYAVDGDYGRSAITFSPEQSSNVGRTGYDFLHRAASHDRQAANNRRHSTAPRQNVLQDRSFPNVGSSQEFGRRRSAAPTMPYPGHSSHKLSTSSVVTVNSSIPSSVNIPQLRIFADSSSSLPSGFRQSSSSGRPFEDRVNSQQSLTSLQEDKISRSSPAESSGNWRRTSLASSETGSIPPALRSPLAKTVLASEAQEGHAQSTEDHLTPVRTKNDRGRRRARGRSKPRGQNAPSKA
ncbi:uncharacterized protein JCM15063_001167 [Sporobolomyces koalae]|uniref:uncharacterized protein n=1 Tax=Sporobolomyces koalae TaxID=500713 RepID=UPI00317FE439